MERFYLMSLLFGLLAWNIGITSSGSIQIVNRSYCYSGSQRVAVCNYDTQIFITDISYERKCTTKCICIGTQCEEFKPANSWENYYFYQQLSGKSSGYFSAKRQPCDSISTTYSNYMHLNYSCVVNDNIIQFGGVQVDDLVTKTGSVVYLQYVGGKHIQNDWYCTASTTSSHDIQVSAVDVRFQKYGVSTGSCDGGLSYLYISDKNQNSTFRCEDKTILGNNDTIFSSWESTITILLHLDGDPQFVWIAVSAGSQEQVNVTCYNVIPTSPPSTTIETTSGVTSSQTTDLIVKSSHNMIEHNWDKTSEVSTQVTEATVSGGSITPQTTYKAVKSTTNIIENNLNGTSATSTQVTETTVYRDSITSQITDKTVKSTTNITENNSNKTLELSPTYKGHSIATKVILEPTSETSVGDNFTLKTSSKPGGMHNTRPVSTTTSRRNLLNKTDLQSDPGFIALITAGVVILLLILIAVIVGRMRFMKNRLQRNRKDNVEQTNELILTDTQKQQDQVIPSSLHRHNDNDSTKMSSSDKVTHEKTKEEPSSLHRHKDNGSLKMSSNDIATHKETKDEPYSLHRHNDNGSLKMSSSNNVTHKKIKDEPYSLSTGTHRDNSSLKMSSSNNVTHKRTREEPSSLNSHKDNDSLKMSLQDNIHAEFTNASDVYSHVDKTRNIDESANYYDRTNHTLYPKQTSTSGSTDHVYDRVEQYGHSYVPTPDGQYTDVQIAQSNNGSLSFPNNIQFHPPDELFPDATRRGSSFSDAIPSPYVDEAVKKGMDSERQYRIRRSSTLSFEHNYDAAIRDLMKEAEDWASKDK